MWCEIMEKRVGYIDERKISRLLRSRWVTLSCGLVCLYSTCSLSSESLPRASRDPRTCHIKADKGQHSPLLSFKTRRGFVMRVFVYLHVEKEVGIFFCSRLQDGYLWGTHVYALTTGAVLMACPSPCSAALWYYTNKEMDRIPDDSLCGFASMSVQ